MSSETELGLLLKCSSAEHADTLQQLLAKASRPDFDDDLEEWQKPLFSVIEEIDYPDRLLVVDGVCLYIEWSETDVPVEMLFRQFKQCGAEFLKAWQFADSGDFEEILYVAKEGKVCVIDAVEEGFKLPSDFDDSPDNPAMLQALRQV